MRSYASRLCLWLLLALVAPLWCAASRTVAAIAGVDGTMRTVGGAVPSTAARGRHCRCCAFASSLRMVSSLRQGGGGGDDRASPRGRRRKSSSSLGSKLSSLSSTPFPTAGAPAAASSAPSEKKTRRFQTRYNSTSWFDDDSGDAYYKEEENEGPSASSAFARSSPFPAMPSPLFANLAQSQFELLSNSLVHGTVVVEEAPKGDGAIGGDDPAGGDAAQIKPGTQKINSMALYLPKENQSTGQLEFVPAVTFPNPSSERVFIARQSDTSSGGVHQPPSVPSVGVLGLPGFFSARSLIPSYPFVSSGGSSGDEESPIGVSDVVEIAATGLGAATSDGTSPSGPSALSVTLFSGLETLGVLMIWPYRSASSKWRWSSNDKQQVTRAAKSLALALSMDSERASTQLANEQFRVAMADSLHQVKSPLQALRTFGKLLQRQLAEEGAGGGRAATVSMERVPMPSSGGGRGRQHALRLAEDMMSQGEHIVDLIRPMDALVQDGGRRYLLRGDIRDPGAASSSGNGGGGALVLQPTSSGDEARNASPQYQLPPSMPIFGDSELEMAFPQDIIGPIVYASQAISREKGINFDAIGFEMDSMDLPGVMVCPKHLKEAVSNLLDNAIKYAPCRKRGRKGRPRIPQIKVTLASNEPPLSPGVTLHIEDNGPGIPESERDKVFERGYRGEEVEDQVGGSGLGLAIAREMISRMGGLLDFVDGPNKLDGTAVRVILFRDPKL